MRIYLTSAFNSAADRRFQNLPFVGEERRALLKDQFRQTAEDQRTAEFLAGVHLIEGLKSA